MLSLMFFIARIRAAGAYAIACGLDQAIDYIKDLHFEQEDIDYLRSTGFFQEDFLDYLKNFRFTGDIYAIPEGTIIFPKDRWSKSSRQSWKPSLLRPLC